jgi:serine/threonine-protein kinase
MTPITASRTRAIDALLPPGEEERLATLVEELSELRGPAAQAALEQMAAAQPSLAGQLRELFAAMMVTDAVAEHSTILSARNRGTAPQPAGSDGARGESGSPPNGGDLDGSSRSMFQPTPSNGLPPGVMTLPVTFGDYELLEEVGRGGMGVVYRAFQNSLGRTVAIKMLLRRDLATPGDLARFRSEAEAAAQLDHPGIVSIFEVGEYEGHPFYSMQFVEGTTLAKRLLQGPLPAREAAALLAKVADAVQAAHDRGVLHRDLKPSNILIDAAGQPHVSDFGLAKRIEADQSVTHTGAILGTPCYMSPEQAAGSRGDVGPQSDVWSLGAILYQMLTGRPPFQAASPMDTLLAVLETDPPLPRLLAPEVVRDLEMIALKTLQKPQELRYASAGALAADLRAYLSGDPLSARSGGLADIAARLFRETHHAVVLENWGLLWMWHSVVLLCLCVTTDVLAWQGVTTRWPYLVLWAGGLALWAPIFWALRHRTGPVTAVERQIAHIWGGSVIASVMLFWVEALLGLPVLTLSPVLALLAGLVFFAKAGILSGAFYIQAAVLFATALVMCLIRTESHRDVSHVVFGLISGACFFLPGLKYYRQRGRAS